MVLWWPALLPRWQAMCLETMLILLCTRPREAAVDHNIILFENVRAARVGPPSLNLLAGGSVV
jgi:hypothetical protein